MARQIFISYRRDDEPGMATALYYHLERKFSAQSLFMDVEGGIAPGHDFVRVLDQQVAQCDIMLVMVGRNWLTATDSQNRRRLDNPDDFVRIEIESALRLGKLVIPVLINRIEMPHASELPDSLKPFARRQAVRLTQERFRSDAQGLEAVIERALFDVRTAQIAAANEVDRKEEEAAQRRRQDVESQRLVGEASIQRREMMETEAGEDQHQVPAIDAENETTDRGRL